MAGALEEDTYRSLLHDAGFVDVEVEVTRRYTIDEIDPSATTTARAGQEAQDGADDGQVVSAFVRARKPAQP